MAKAVKAKRKYTRKTDKAVKPNPYVAKINELTTANVYLKDANNTLTKTIEELQLQLNDRVKEIKRSLLIIDNKNRELEIKDQVIDLLLDKIAG